MYECGCVCVCVCVCVCGPSPSNQRFIGKLPGVGDHR